ncbi:MAG: tRNA pseudouridine synthase A [Candidatus Hydrothermales bacterium]
MRFKMKIEYDGTNFYGWQVQKGFRTVQGVLDEVIKKLLLSKKLLQGASRTDRGVHAIGQVAHFDAPARIFKERFNRDTESLRKAINALLPRDIYIRELEVVSDKFHARRDAKLKIYRYTILLGRSPLESRYAWEINFNINYKLFYKMCKLIMIERDFSPFSPLPEGRGIIKIENSFAKREGNKIFLYFAARRFLNKMVRSIVGQMVYFSSRNDLDGFKRVIENGPETLIIAPPQGLCLIDVLYD